jgi:hypothetical protein
MRIYSSNMGHGSRLHQSWTNKKKHHFNLIFNLLSKFVLSKLITYKVSSKTFKMVNFFWVNFTVTLYIYISKTKNLKNQREEIQKFEEEEEHNNK